MTSKHPQITGMWNFSTVCVSRQNAYLFIKRCGCQESISLYTLIPQTSFSLTSPHLPTSEKRRKKKKEEETIQTNKQKQVQTNKKQKQTKQQRQKRRQNTQNNSKSNNNNNNKERERERAFPRMCFSSSAASELATLLTETKEWNLTPLHRSLRRKRQRNNN